MWGRFFESLGGGDDSESIVSGSNYPGESHSRTMSRSLSHLVQSDYSEVHPNDSASVIDEEPASVMEGYHKSEVHSATGLAPVPPVDDGTYVFKFRTPSGRTHRFQARHDNVENLRDIVAGKLATDPFFTNLKTEEGAEAPDPNDFLLSYTDADGDIVLITSDTDVTDAVKIARSAGSDRVVLFVQGGKGWADVVEKSAAQAAEVKAAAQEEIKAVETVEATLPEAVNTAPPAPVHVHQEEEKVLGIPKDLLLPASIGALAAVILGVFTISRLTR